MSFSVAGQPADLTGGKARGIKAFLAHADLFLALVTEIPAAVLIVVETCLLCAGVVARYVFDRPISWSDEMASIMFLWLAMLGATIALRLDLPRGTSDRHHPHRFFPMVVDRVPIT